MAILQGPTVAQSLSTTLRSLLERVLADNGSKVAAINGRSGKSVTFEELLNRSERIARTLASKGFKFIGVSLAPSIELLTLTIGLVRQGIPFVAIDPSLPQDRVDYIIADSQVEAVIYSSRQPYESATAGWLEISDLVTADSPPRTPKPVNNEDTFCVLYTSGSSGRSKGVQIPHRALLNRLEWQWRTRPFQTSDVVAAKTQFGFVDSIAETWAPLLKAIPIVYVPKTILMTPSSFIELLNHYQITRLTIVPSLLRVLLATMRADGYRLDHLQSLIASGETLTQDLCQQFFEQFTNCSLSNYYGCTEVMADVTAITFESLDDVRRRTYDGLVSIGEPVDNTTLILHDVDTDGIGELVFTGGNVTKGYLGQAASREVRFVTAAELGIDPSLVDPKALCFRTGDRGKIVDGQVIYYGRNDSQVKIAGNRVDLSEVEAALEKAGSFEHPPVVLSHDGHILAFVLSKDRSEQIGRDKLSQALPSYAIPEFVPIEDIPLLAVSGKVDRQALIELYQQRSTIEYDWDTFNDLDGKDKIKYRTLVNVLSELGIRVSTSLSDLLNKNFFQVGGTSLNAILSIAIFKRKGYSITIEDLLTSKTFRDIVDKLSVSKGHDGQDSTSDICAKKRWTFRPLSDSIKVQTSTIIADNFCDENLTMYITCGDKILEQECIEDMHSVINEFWPYTITDDPNQYISFGMFDDQDRLIGVAGNFGELNQPQDLPSGKHIPKIVIFLSECEEPLVEKLKHQGHGNILHGFVMAVDKKILTDPSDRVQGMLMLERHLIQVGRARGFDAIVTTNTSEMTQDAAEYILGYEVYKVVGQLNQWRPGPDEDILFKGATDDAVVKVCYKLLKD